MDKPIHCRKATGRRAKLGNEVRGERHERRLSGR